MKRSFRTALAGAVVALGLVAAGTTAYSAFADADDPNALLFADYENGELNSGNAGIELGKCCTYSIKTASFGRDSDIAIQHELRQSDPEYKNGMRSESDALRSAPARFGAGDSRYYAFSVYLPSTWEQDAVAEDIVFQWHNTPNTTVEPCETSKTPSAFLAVHPNDGSPEWRLRLNSDANGCTTADSIVKTHLGLGAIATGQWTDFVFKFDWAYDESGRVEVWQRTSQNPTWTHAAKDGGNTYNDKHDSGYLKWGIYKPGWNDGATTGVVKRAVFHDNIAAGTTCASVMPTGWAPPSGCGGADANAAPAIDSGDPASAPGTAQPRALARRRKTVN